MNKAHVCNWCKRPCGRGNIVKDVLTKHRNGVTREKALIFYWCIPCFQLHEDRINHALANYKEKT